MEFIDWLFNTRNGMFALMLGGMALFAIIAFIAERRTHKLYFDHSTGEEDEDDWGFGWGDDDDDAEAIDATTAKTSPADKNVDHDEDEDN